MTHSELFPACAHRLFSIVSPYAAIVSKIKSAALVLPTRVARKELYMDAIKFRAEFARMCTSYETCSECAMPKECRECASLPSNYTTVITSAIVKAVEDWSATHQVTTRAALFKKTHPFVLSDSSGALLICPVVVDKNVICPLNGDCKQCRKNYWLKEV